MHGDFLEKREKLWSLLREITYLGYVRPPPALKSPIIPLGGNFPSLEIENPIER
jgi:hypothetical protein